MVGRRHVVISRVLVSGAVIAALTTAITAQTQVGLDDAPAQQEAALVKRLVSSYEQTVASAVVEGGRLVQADVARYVPDLQLRLAGRPIVSGAPVEGVGFVFDVQCPDIMGTQLFYLEMFKNSPELITTGRTATPLPADFDAGRLYGEHVRASLRAAMVDFSTPLPIDDTERLIVVARVPSSGEPDLQENRKLILQITGEDLRLFHSRVLSRDEAIQRVRETRF
jgi:hypothetical protein